MSTSLLARIAYAEAQGHTRYGAAQRFGPLTAVDAGPITVLSTAWLGASGLTAANLAAYEEFCRQHELAPTLHLLSHAAPKVLPLLTERHYTLNYVLHVYAHDLQDLPTAPDLEIQQERDPQRWAELSAQGFEGGLEIMRVVAAAPHTLLYIALLDGQDAGSAATSLVGGVAAFHGTSTLANFRGRGAQTALLTHRLHAAAGAGAELATVFVTPGTASERNIARAGFRLVGMRLTFGKVVGVRD